jgi:hypothetical protein
MLSTRVLPRKHRGQIKWLSKHKRPSSVYLVAILLIHWFINVLTLPDEEKLDIRIEILTVQHTFILFYFN